MYTAEEYARSETIARAEDASLRQRFLADPEVPDELKAELISGRMTIQECISNDVQRRRALRLALRAG